MFNRAPIPWGNGWRSKIHNNILARDLDISISEQTFRYNIILIKYICSFSSCLHQNMVIYKLTSLATLKVQIQTQIYAHKFLYKFVLIRYIYSCHVPDDCMSRVKNIWMKRGIHTWEQSYLRSRVSTQAKQWNLITLQLYSSRANLKSIFIQLTRTLYR